MLLSENKITEIYCLADDFCRFYGETVKNNALEEHDGKRHRNKPNRLSDAENITPYLSHSTWTGSVASSISTLNPYAAIGHTCFPKLCHTTGSWSWSVKSRCCWSYSSEE